MLGWGEGGRLLWQVPCGGATSVLWANQFAAFCGEDREYAFAARIMMDYNPGVAPLEDASRLSQPTQADMLHEVVLDLGLEEVTLVMHDFGSIVGSQQVYKYPEFVKRVTIWGRRRPPPLRVYFIFLSFYQQDAILAYLAQDDAAMDANVRASA